MTISIAAIIISLSGCNSDNPPTVPVVPASERPGSGIIAKEFVTYDGVHAVIALAVADVNADALQDVVVSENQSLLLYPADAGGGFSRVMVDDDFRNGDHISIVDLADDGDLDIVGASGGRNPAVAWWEHTDADFQRHDIDHPFVKQVTLKVADLEGDDDMDLVTLMLPNSIGWWRNDGSESFSMLKIDHDLESIADITVSDIEPDGDPDIVAVESGSNGIVIFENDGDAAFSPHSHGPGINNAGSVHTADLDNDGDTDIITPGFGSKAVWWRQDEEGDFSPRIIESISEGSQLVPADIDGDSDVDLIASATFSAWLNNGTGEFNNELVIASSRHVTGPLLPADINGDGLLDILARTMFSSLSADGSRDLVWFRNVATEELPKNVPEWNSDAVPELVAWNASTTLANDKVPDRYAASKVTDGDPRTSWVEGSEDDGIGERIELIIEPPVAVQSLMIMPGYFDERYWADNNRVARVSFKFTDDVGFITRLESDLSDSMEPQIIPVGLRTIWKLEIEILKVYSGEKWKDTAIAEVSFIGRRNRIPLATAEHAKNTPPVGGRLYTGVFLGLSNWYFYRDGTYEVFDRDFSDTGFWSYSDGRIYVTRFLRTVRRGESGASSGDPIVYDWSVRSNSENWQKIKSAEDSYDPAPR